MKKIRVPNYSIIANKQIRHNRANCNVNHEMFLVDRQWALKHKHHANKNK